LKPFSIYLLTPIPIWPVLFSGSARKSARAPPLSPAGRSTTLPNRPSSAAALLPSPCRRSPASFPAQRSPVSRPALPRRPAEADGRAPPVISFLRPDPSLSLAQGRAAAPAPWTCAPRACGLFKAPARAAPPQALSPGSRRRLQGPAPRNPSSPPPGAAALTAPLRRRSVAVRSPAVPPQGKGPAGVAGFHLRAPRRRVRVAGAAPSHPLAAALEPRPLSQELTFVFAHAFPSSWWSFRSERSTPAPKRCCAAARRRRAAVPASSPAAPRRCSACAGPGPLDLLPTAQIASSSSQSSPVPVNTVPWIPTVGSGSDGSDPSS
jgi:hypothetical protein